jgi:regulator of sigma E protease
VYWLPLLAAFSLAGWLGNFWTLFLVALGLGLVIFVHELGHFAVAKWCGVKVERFSMGFGPILLRFRRGETEYALSAIPFGGYVKMLGQDDADPGEMTNQEIKLDPRSYPAQSVPKRMAIISAGVIMNVLFGFLAFLIVYNAGFEYVPAVVGEVMPGSPAWEAGLQPHDQIIAVRGGEAMEFSDLSRKVNLADPREGAIQIKFRRAETVLTADMTPEQRAMFPAIGVVPARDTVLLADPLPGSAGQAAGLKRGDRITHADGKPLRTAAELNGLLRRQTQNTIVLLVSRPGESKDGAAQQLELKLPPQHVRDFGLVLRMGPITRIRVGSPATRAKAEGQSTALQVGDVITKVNGGAADPLRLPDLVAALAGKPVVLEVRRELTPGQPTTHTVTIEPDSQPGWANPPEIYDCPLAAPAIGVAYRVVPVLAADPAPGSPAAQAGLQAGDRLVAARISYPIGEGPATDVKYPVDPADGSVDPERVTFAFLFWQLQDLPNAEVVFDFERGSDGVRTAKLNPVADPTWGAATRGIELAGLTYRYQSEGFLPALQLGWRKTGSTLTDIYIALRRMAFTRTLSPRGMSGPVGLAQMAWAGAQRGMLELILLLGLLSVNLAVINFLPIPVLDGGHMVFLAWEGIRGKPADPRVQIGLSYAGLAAILGLMVWVTYLDISRTGWFQNLVGK